MPMLTACNGPGALIIYWHAVCNRFCETFDIQAEKGREKLVSTFVENWQILDENSWKLSVSSDRNRNATGAVEATNVDKY